MAKYTYAACYVALEIGLLAEKSGAVSQALESAQSAQLKAQSQSIYDCLYQAYWLAGRMYQKNGQTKNAIAALDAIYQAEIELLVLSACKTSLSSDCLSG